jgi:hypothetical protein
MKLSQHGTGNHHGHLRKDIPGYYLGVNKKSHHEWMLVTHVEKVIPTHNYMQEARVGDVIALNSDHNVTVVGRKGSDIVIYSPTSHKAFVTNLAGMPQITLRENIPNLFQRYPDILHASIHNTASKVIDHVESHHIEDGTKGKQELTSHLESDNTQLVTSHKLEPSPVHPDEHGEVLQPHTPTEPTLKSPIQQHYKAGIGVPPASTDVIPSRLKGLLIKAIQTNGVKQLDDLYSVNTGTGYAFYISPTESTLRKLAPHTNVAEIGLVHDADIVKANQHYGLPSPNSNLYYLSTEHTNSTGSVQLYPGGETYKQLEGSLNDKFNPKNSHPPLSNTSDISHHDPLGVFSDEEHQHKNDSINTPKSTESMQLHPQLPKVPSSPAVGAWSNAMRAIAKDPHLKVLIDTTPENTVRKFASTALGATVLISRSLVDLYKADPDVVAQISKDHEGKTVYFTAYENSLSSSLTDYSTLVKTVPVGTYEGPPTLPSGQLVLHKTDENVKEVKQSPTFAELGHNLTSGQIGQIKQGNLLTLMARNPKLLPQVVDPNAAKQIESTTLGGVKVHHLTYQADETEPDSVTKYNLPIEQSSEKSVYFPKGRFTEEHELPDMEDVARKIFSSEDIVSAHVKSTNFFFTDNKQQLYKLDPTLTEEEISHTKVDANHNLIPLIHPDAVKFLISMRAKYGTSSIAPVPESNSAYSNPEVKRVLDEDLDGKIKVVKHDNLLIISSPYESVMRQLVHYSNPIQTKSGNKVFIAVLDLTDHNSTTLSTLPNKEYTHSVVFSKLDRDRDLYYVAIPSTIHDPYGTVTRFDNMDEAKASLAELKDKINNIPEYTKAGENRQGSIVKDVPLENNKLDEASIAKSFNYKAIGTMTAMKDPAIDDQVVRTTAIHDEKGNFSHFETTFRVRGDDLVEAADKQAEDKSLLVNGEPSFGTWINGEGKYVVDPQSSMSLIEKFYSMWDNNGKLNIYSTDLGNGDKSLYFKSLLYTFKGIHVVITKDPKNLEVNVQNALKKAGLNHEYAEKEDLEQMKWQKLAKAALSSNDYQHVKTLDKDQVREKLKEYYPDVDNIANENLSQVSGQIFPSFSEEFFDKVIKPQVGDVYAEITSRKGLQGLTSSGGLISTLNRYTNGLKLPGSSAIDDLESGGAQYVFTRLAQNRTELTIGQTLSRGTSIRINPEVLRTAHHFSYPHDLYGVVDPKYFKYNGAYSQRAPAWQVAQGVDSSYDIVNKHERGNETMMKQNLPHDFVDEIIVASNGGDMDVLNAMYHYSGLSAEQRNVTKVKLVKLTGDRVSEIHEMSDDKLKEFYNTLYSAEQKEYDTNFPGLTKKISN